MEQKNPDHLQAQVDAFIQDLDYKELSEINEKKPDLVQIQNLDQVDSTTEVGGIVEKYRDRYTDFLRTPEGRAKVEARLKYIQLFEEKFAAPVAELKARITQAEADDTTSNLINGGSKNLPEYLGSGSNGSAYKITVDGQDYAVKLHNSDYPIYFDELVGAERVDNVPHLMAFSPKDKVTIMPLLSGTEITKNPDNIVPEIAKRHIQGLIKTVAELHDLGLAIDPKASNFMYDPEKGFEVLDFQVRANPANNFAEQLRWLQAPLTYYNYSAETKLEGEGKEAFIRKSKLRALRNLLSLVEVLAEDYPEELKEMQDSYEVIQASPWMGTSALVTTEHYPDDPEIQAIISELRKFGLSSVVDDGEEEPQGLPETTIFEKSLTPEGRKLLESQWATYHKAKSVMVRNGLEERIRKGELEFPEGTLIHGTRYDRAKLTSIAKHGVVSGELMGVPEDCETHYCADFFRVSEDMSLDDYLSFISTPEQVGKIRKTKMETNYFPRPKDRTNKIGIVFDTNNPVVQALQENDAYRSDNKTLDSVINQLPIKDEEAVKRVSAILGGLPANLISGLVIPSTIANDPEEVSFLKKRFPKAVLLAVEGEKM